MSLKIALILVFTICFHSLCAQGEQEPSHNGIEWWIIIANISVMAIAFYFFYRWRINIHKQHEDHLLSEISKATEQIKNDKLFIENQSRQILKMDKSKTKFFKNVSHELRTPLTMILGPLSGMQKSGDLSASNLKLINHAENNAKSLLRLVESILDLSKLESGNFSLKEEPELIYPLFKRFASVFESHAQNENKTIILNYEANVNLCLNVDRNKLEVIFNNLLSNALKFTNSGGKIDIDILDKINEIEISISDNGIGIHKDDLPYIFNRFFESSHTDTNQGGSKIGLALSKELSRVMGGNIFVSSTYGRGSKFSLTIPKKEVLGAHHVSELTSKTENIPIDVDNMDHIQMQSFDENRATVLIVEDNSNLREYLSTILCDMYNVITAENGKVALDMFEKDQDRLVADIIISDIMMPVMDGYALLSALKENERYRAIPVIMLTARAEIQDKLKALRMGVDDYIFKPYDESELFVRIKNLLANYKVRKESSLTNNERSQIPLVSMEDKKWLEECETYILENISNDLLSVPYLARQFSMSESTINRQLKRLTGMSTGKYLQEIRLNCAKDHIEKRRFSTIAKVAYEVGFKDSKSFSRAFKQRFGKIPSELIELV